MSNKSFPDLDAYNEFTNDKQIKVLSWNLWWKFENYLDRQNSFSKNTALFLVKDTKITEFKGIFDDKTNQKILNYENEIYFYSFILRSNF